MKLHPKVYDLYLEICKANRAKFGGSGRDKDENRYNLRKALFEAKNDSEREEIAEANKPEAKPVAKRPVFKRQPAQVDEEGAEKQEAEGSDDVKTVVTPKPEAQAKAAATPGADA